MRYIYLAIIALLAVSCSETKMLQKSINKFNAPIGYLHDSKKTSDPTTDSVIVKLNTAQLDSTTNVSRISNKILPFLFYNYTEVNWNVKLGQRSIQQNYNDFFTSSLTEESKRTGRFGISSQKSNDSLYTLEITIDSCDTQSKYQRNSTVMFFFIAYSMSFYEKGFPAETNLQVSTKLRKGNTLISEKKYTIKQTQPFLNTGSVNVKKLQSDFTANMVESLSLCTKQCIEDMIRDINSSIKDKKS